MMHSKAFFSTFICIFFWVTVPIGAVQPVTPDASPQARALLNYLYTIKGEKILSGQMYAPWGIDEISTIESITGKLPAMRGQDLINEPANSDEIRQAQEWWEAGGIPTIMWHWGAPTVGEGYEASKGTVENFENLFIEGTYESREMWADLERIADYLTILRDADVPVIWRPMHECSGGWFWWDKSGSDGFKRLWRTMFEYFAHERELNNLIWFLGYDGSPNRDYDPGDGYYDLAGGDTYSSDSPFGDIYNSCRTIHGIDIPVAMHECGTIPNPDECEEQQVMWSWWMLWHTSHLSNHNPEALEYAYNHDLVLTRDELPDIMNYLDVECIPVTVASFVQINGGEWEENANINLTQGDSFILGPHPYESGSWRWNGPNGFAADSREIEFGEATTKLSGTYFGTYTSLDGCQSVCTVSVAVEPTTLTLQTVRNDESSAVTFKENLLSITGNTTDLFEVNLYDLRGSLLFQRKVRGNAFIKTPPLIAKGSYMITVHSRKNLLFHKRVFSNE